MIGRGWTEESVFEAIRNPASSFEAKDVRHLDDGSGARKDESARAYMTDDGQYVVVNLTTNEVIAVSDRTKPTWRIPSWYQ